MGPRDVLINWSLSMDMRRRGFGPVNWGNTLSVLPDEETCESTSVPQVDVIWGTFEVNATVPEGQNPIILVQALSPCSCLLRTVSQSPHVRQLGDQAFLLGNLKELASWNAQEAVKMMKQPNTSSTWTAVVSVGRLQILSPPSSSYTIDKWHLKKKTSFLQQPLFNTSTFSNTQVCSTILTRSLIALVDGICWCLDLIIFFLSSRWWICMGERLWSRPDYSQLWKFYW